MLTEKLKRYGTFGTHDALKLAGLALMIADHLGSYVFPEAHWLRLIGRACAPIFFFLIGYSGSYRILPDLVLAAVFMVGLKFAHTHSLASPNILVGFIAARLLLQLAEKYPALLKYPWIAFAILVLPGSYGLLLFQYGTLGLMFTLLGYMQKNAQRYHLYSRALMFVAAAFLYAAVNSNQMHLEGAGQIVLLAIMGACGWMLWRYRPRALDFGPKLRWMEPVLAWPARYSLWIYVVHLAALQIVTGKYV